MPSDPFTMLFGGVLALALLLALLEWFTHHRRMAVAALMLAALAAALLAFELASVRTSIRVDLLFTVPLISLTAAAVGVLAMLGPPFSARALGALLTAAGAITLGWCGWSLAGWMARSNLIDLARNEGRALYWQEAMRCQANLEKRFGPLQRRDSPCVGNLAVLSRSDSGYPYSRVVVNDSAEFYLLVAETNGAEDTNPPGAAPFGPLKPGPNGSLHVESDPSARQPAVELRPASSGACEARIRNDYLKRTDTYSLRRVELGSCPAPINPPVHFLGAWGSLVEAPAPPVYPALTQVWFWESRGTGYALILAAARAPSSNYVRRFTGRRNAEGVWQLRGADQNHAEEDVSVTVSQGRLDLRRGASETVLDPGEVATHPAIALVPVREAALFERYFNTVFFDFYLP